MAEIFGDATLPSPQQSSKGNIAGAATTTATATVGSGRRSSSTPPTATSPSASAGGSVATDVAQSSDVAAVEDFQPTHIVYLDASLEYIVSQQGLRGGGTEGAGGAAGKEAEAKLRADLERYFAEEQQQADTQSDNKGGDDGVGGGGNSDSSRREGERWIPATARALQERYAITAAAIDAEGEGEDDGGEGGVSVSGVVSAVDQHLCGGEVPAFVGMLSGGSGGASSAVEEGGSSAEEEEKKVERQEIAGGVYNSSRVHSMYDITFLGRGVHSTCGRQKVASIGWQAVRVRYVASGIYSLGGFVFLPQPIMFAFVRFNV